MVIRKMNKNKLSVLLISVILLAGFTFAVIPASAYNDVIIVPRDYPTIQDAIIAANDGDTILVGPGEWYGGIVNKLVRIIGLKGAIIVDGPAYPQMPGMPDSDQHMGFYVEPEGSGSTISNLVFLGGPIEGTDFYFDMAVFARGADDVTIIKNKIYNCGQCITNWKGNNWVIIHNVIEGYSQVMGRVSGIVLGSQILGPGSPEGRECTGNLVAFNIIDADPEPSEYGSYGISIRGWMAPAYENKIIFNRIRITGSDTAAIRLYAQDWQGDIEYAKSLVCDNEIRLNNLLGSTNAFLIEPPELHEVNTISLNHQ